MSQKSGSLLAAILTIATAPVVGQWLHVPAKGIPRTEDGKPDLSAPAPRKPDNKPDLSGIWRGEPHNQKLHDDMAAGFDAGEFPIQPWAELLVKQRRTDAGAREFRPARCLPPGVPMADTQPILPFKIVQEPELVVILSEAMSFRQIFLDGRTPSKDSRPTWWGYSVGRWEGDVLVVDSTGFNGTAWLDTTGHPTTQALHITERFQRRDFGHLDLQLTIDDPKAYTKPWTVTLPTHFEADAELLEYVCNA